MARQRRRQFAPELLDVRITPTPLSLDIQIEMAPIGPGPSIPDPNALSWPYVGTMPDTPLDLRSPGDTQPDPGRPEYFPQPSQPDLLGTLFPEPQGYQLQPNDPPPVDYTWIDGTL